MSKKRKFTLDEAIQIVTGDCEELLDESHEEDTDIFDADSIIDYSSGTMSSHSTHHVCCQPLWYKFTEPFCPQMPNL